MTPTPAFKRYLRIGKESTWGSTPTSTLEYNAGGSMFSAITTSELGALKYAEVKHRTKGATGRRTMDQH